MTDRALGTMASDDLRAGLRVSAASIAWTPYSSVAAVAIGIAAGSLVLIAFGLTGVLDAAGSATLVVHFRHALRFDTFSERDEHLALRVIVGGLLSVGGLTAVESVRRLASRAPSQSAPAGVVLAVISIVVLAGLSRRKLAVARRIPSRALLADGGLTAMGCLLVAELGYAVAPARQGGGIATAAVFELLAPAVPRA